jgi:hypothetical protein
MIPMTDQETAALSRYTTARNTLRHVERLYADEVYDLGREAKLIEAHIDLHVAESPEHKNETVRKAAAVVVKATHVRLQEIQAALHAREQELGDAKASFDAAHMAMRCVLAQTGCP